MKKMVLLLLINSACATLPTTPIPTPSVTPVESPTPSPSPTDSPSPLPSPSVSPTPVPSLSPTPTPTIQVTQLIAMKGETLGLKLIAKNTATPPIEVTAYDIGQVQTLIPSFKGAQAGIFDDPLIPATSFIVGESYWVDILVSVPEIIDVLGNRISIATVPYTMPTLPSVPMYMELTSHDLLAAHKLADNVANQGPITQKYIDLYRAHRIEPIKQNITTYPPLLGAQIDFDKWSNFGGSFRQLVLSGAIAPPCMFGPLPNLPPDVQTLNALQAAIVAHTLPLGSWAYAWDEGEGNASLTAQALARAQLIKQNAPGLQVMTTRQEDVNFVPFVDIFYPVMDWFKQPGKVQNYTKPYGLYTSCMANGNCSNQTSAVTVQSPSGAPMMVVDASPVHWRAFPVVGYSMGASALLYYDGTKKITTALTPGGLYNEGGNGDGTLVYPCGANACPSLRLKYLRRGLQDIEWIRLARTKGMALPVIVQDTLHWSKNESDYDAIKTVVTGQ